MMRFLLSLALSLGFLSEPTRVDAQASTRSKEILPSKTWFGILKEESKRKLAPRDRFLTDAADFAKLWKAWKPDDQVPTIDFGKDLVIVATSDTVRIDKIVLELDKDGDLSFTLGAAASKSDPAFPSFGMAQVSRTGIRSIAGRPVKK